jgi:hypothetical protein
MDLSRSNPLPCPIFSINLITVLGLAQAVSRKIFSLALKVERKSIGFPLYLPRWGRVNDITCNFTIVQILQFWHPNTVFSS